LLVALNELDDICRAAAGASLGGSGLLGLCRRHQPRGNTGTCQNADREHRCTDDDASQHVLRDLKPRETLYSSEGEDLHHVRQLVHTISSKIRRIAASAAQQTCSQKCSRANRFGEADGRHAN
jgi:hypothetical protein